MVFKFLGQKQVKLLGNVVCVSSLARPVLGLGTKGGDRMILTFWSPQLSCGGSGSVTVMWQQRQWKEPARGPVSQTRREELAPSVNTRPWTETPWTPARTFPGALRAERWGAGLDTVREASRHGACQASAWCMFRSSLLPYVWRPVRVLRKPTSGGGG